MFTLSARKSLALLVFAAALSLAPHAAIANSVTYKEKLDDIAKSVVACIDKAAGTTADLLECSANAYREYDALLNESYRALRNAVKGDAAYSEALRAEQAAWKKLNKAAIKHIYKTGGGGSNDRINAAGVSTQLIINRIELFIYLLHSKEDE